MPRLLATADELSVDPSRPGPATGPFTYQGRTAVGEARLFNRAEVVRALSADVADDTELLLIAYVRLGVDAFRLAEGAFVLAIRDGNELVLVRDSVGARTMFYTRTADGWAASSSLRALRGWIQRPSIDLGAVASFLTFAYLPGEQTLLRDVRELLPGRCVRLPGGGEPVVENYWEPQENTVDADHAAALRERLERATARRLPAAEAVAVTLSGGIDSSLVTALATTLHDQPVHTYSISFGDGPDELGYSGLVAAHCGTEHRVLTVSGEDIAQRMADTVALLEAPVGDPLTVPNLLLAEAAAADGACVLLNGEGGDPVFGGPKNLPMLVFELHRTDPAPAARAAAYLATYRKCHEDLPVLLTPAALAAMPALTDLVEPFLHSERMPSLLNRLLYCNLRTKGAHHILPKVERLTAACGIEARSPLFDRDVIDCAFAIPPALKLRGACEKWILKEAVRDLLPATIIDRPKSGMRVPVQQWLRGPLHDLCHDVLLTPTAATGEIIRPSTIRRWLRGDGLLLPRQGGKIWQVLTLELWLRAHGLAA